MIRHPRERKQLDRLLDQRNEHPERIPQLDGRIREQFEAPRAVLVLDMCGFSRVTLRHGIIHYLAMIRRTHQTVLPIVAARGGHVFKTEADNVFATFPKVPAAIAAATDIQAELARANSVLPSDWDVHVGIGVGFGPLLVIGEDDVYGSEMNLASKLGEDVAEAGDVLLTEGAFAAAGRDRKRFRKKAIKLGRLKLPYYARSAGR